MYEIIRWISLAMLWVALGLNIFSMVLNLRTRKRLKASCDIMQRLIKEWEEKHNELEVEESKDEGND